MSSCFIKCSRKKLIISLLLCGIHVVCFSQSLKGKVNDAVAGESLIGANVLVRETGQRVFVELDGYFRVQLVSSAKMLEEAAVTSDKRETGARKLEKNAAQRSTSCRPGQSNFRRRLLRGKNPISINLSGGAYATLDRLAYVTGFDFHLQSGSPAIGKGNTSFPISKTNIPINPNFSATSIDLPGADIGCYQSNGNGMKN